MFLDSVGLNFMGKLSGLFLAVNVQALEDVGDGVPPAFVLCSVGSGAKVLVHF